jgi:hypothetical protein
MANTVDATLSSLESYAEITRLKADSDDLVVKVLNKVQDASYSYDDVLDTFNQCCLELSGQFLFDDLEVMRDIVTAPNRGSIPAPSDFQKNLRYAHSTTHNRQIKVYGSLIKLYREFSQLDQSGVVVGIAVKGRRFYYQRIPSTEETIRVNYWGYPERMETRYSKPTFLPVHLVEALLVNYACAEIYSEIEDGIEGQKVNTQFYQSKYDKALADLSMFLGPEEKIPEGIHQEIDWNGMFY